MIMKHIILAQNINIAKKGLEDLKYNLEVFEISKVNEMIEQRKEFSNILNKYEKDLLNLDITLVEVDDILNFIDKTNSLIIKILT